jgi:cytochrome P450
MTDSSFFWDQIMQDCINKALPIFDQLEAADDAWNVYQYMVKLASAAVAKVVLGMDFDHFSEVDSPLNPMVAVIAEVLSLNKKIASKGEVYANLPFGDPKKLHDLQHWQQQQVDEMIKHHESSGDNDLELQDAALEAANMIDYLCRATDSSGKKLPKENLIAATIVASGAGFSTTATLLSWLIYGLVRVVNSEMFSVSETIAYLSDAVYILHYALETEHIC